MKRITHFLITLLLLALLAACVPAEPTNPASESMVETRAITHALGETEVPIDPQSIVSLNPMVTDNLIALGIQPAAIATFNGSDFTSYEYMAERLVDVPIIGTFVEPNQEAIVQLDPDLIIGRDRDMADTYDTLSQIAPTVAIEDQDNFRSWLAQVANVVGLSESVDARLAEFDAKAAAASVAIAEAVGEESAAFLRIRPDQIRIYTGLRIGGPILYNELGLAEPDFVAALPEENFVQLSLEEIPQMAEADHIFLLDQSPADEPSPVFDSPLWDTLPAVQNGQVYEAPRDIWINLGILAAEDVIDAVVLTLTGEPLAHNAMAASTGSAAECEVGFRLFTHELLESEPVCIPENPERIASLAPAAFEIMLAIGEDVPVGAIGYLESIYQRNFPYTDEAAAEVEFVGFPANLEAVFALQPDLIVQSPYGQEDIELVQGIAPTVVLPLLPNVQWEENMRFTSELLNRNEEVEALIAQYDGRVATLQELIGDPSAIEVSVVRYYDDSGASGLQLQLANAFSTDILADVGFARPESQAMSADEAAERYGSPVAATLSLEELPLLDGEYLFAWSQAANAEGDEANEGAWTALSEDPLWATLEAVQNEQTFQVGGHWVGWGFHAAHEVLDDLFLYVAGVDPADVSPNPFQ
ncbi:MAG: iron-siderophore ABC transporter substrate-binding protein [Chloroflexota bacterium]